MQVLALVTQKGGTGKSSLAVSLAVAAEESGLKTCILDVDPLFRDPASGDFRLKESSPCIDAGDPAATTARRDLFGRPRRLDGHLVRAERVDMGAFESGPITLQITGNATPGGTVTIAASGNAQLLVWLHAGLDGTAIDHRFLGTFYVDFATALPLLPWAPAPSSTPVMLPAGLPVPLEVHVQLLGVRASDGAGGTSNDVILRIE